MDTPTSVEETRWNSDFHVVLPGMEQARVLLLPGDGGWMLPFLRVEGHLWVGDSYEIMTHLREHLGLVGNFTISV